MNNNSKLDKILYQMGEEDTIQQMDNPHINHEFSSKYLNQKREVLEYALSNHECRSERKQRRSWKRWQILVAAIILLLSLSASAYATVKVLFHVQANLDTENDGTFTYTFETEANIKVPPVKIIPCYIPNGYQIDGQPGAKTLIGENRDTYAQSKSGISISTANSSTQVEIPHISKVDDLKLNGIKAQLLTRKGSPDEYYLFLFFEENGNIIQLIPYGDIPLDEVKKVAEGLSYEIIPKETLGENYSDRGYYAFQDTSDQSEPELESMEEAPITTENFFKLNEERMDIYQIIDPSAEWNFTYTVHNIEILDKLPDIDPDEMLEWNHDEFLTYLNEDKTLKKYERISEIWAADEMLFLLEDDKLENAYISFNLSWYYEAGKCTESFIKVKQ